MGADIGPLERATARAVDGYVGPLALMSFNPNTTALLHDLCPDIACGITTSGFDPAGWAPLPKSVCDHLREIPDYDRSGASFISHEVADLTRDRVTALKSAGANVLCWTVTSPDMEARAREVAENVTFEQYLARHPVRSPS